MVDEINLKGLLEFRESLRRQEQEATQRIKTIRSGISHGTSANSFRGKWSACVERERGYRKEIKLRRQQVFKALRLLGYSKVKISKIMNLGIGTINRIEFLLDRIEIHKGDLFAIDDGNRCNE